MLIYIIVFLLAVSLFPARRSLFVTSVFFVVVTLLIGFRDDIGVDYAAYKDWYDHEIFGDFSMSYVEPGFTLIAECAKFLGVGSWLLFVVSASITTFFIFNAIRANCQVYLLAASLFFFGGGYTFSINGVRQAIAASIFIYAARYLVSDKRLIYAALIAFASAFHYSVLMLMPLLFVPLGRRFSFSVYISAYGLIAAAVLTLPLDALVGSLLSKITFLPLRYEQLVDSGDYLGQAELGSGLGMLLKQSLVIVTLIASARYLNISPVNNLFFNLYYLSAVLTLVSLDVVLVSRVAEYFSWSMFIFIPLLAHCMPRKVREVFLTFYLLCVGAMFIAGAVNPAYKISPYESVLGKVLGA